MACEAKFACKFLDMRDPTWALLIIIAVVPPVSPDGIVVQLPIYKVFSGSLEGSKTALAVVEIALEITFPY